MALDEPVTLSKQEIAREALQLFRGAHGQQDDEARKDVELATAVQDAWTAGDRAAVLRLFDRLQGVKDDLEAQQDLLDGYVNE